MIHEVLSVDTGDRRPPPHDAARTSRHAREQNVCDLTGALPAGLIQASRGDESREQKPERPANQTSIALSISRNGVTLLLSAVRQRISQRPALAPHPHARLGGAGVCSTYGIYYGSCRRPTHLLLLSCAPTIAGIPTGQFPNVQMFQNRQLARASQIGGCCYVMDIRVDFA
jgi:hypothetical protein